MIPFTLLSLAALDEQPSCLCKKKKDLSKSTEKNFESILNDYDFFVHHSNESTMNLLALRERILAKGVQNSVHVLDFGCGSGEFLFNLIQSAFRPNMHLDICLVEPSETYRSNAERAFSGQSHVKVSTWEEFDATRKKRYDLILSNHVLYYVKDFRELFQRFFRAAHPDTQILITLGSENNSLNEILKSACHRLGRGAPNKSAADLTQFLEREEISFQTTYVESSLTFPDHSSHRDQVMRFILGPIAEDFQQMPVDLLDEYLLESNIVVPLFDVVFEVKPKFAAAAMVASDRRLNRKAG